MASFTDFYATLDPDPVVRGHQFEPVTGWFLQNDPGYRRIFRKVWMWNDWPDRWGIDAGIDLVAETHTGDLWAIQVKAYAETTSISKRDVDRFLSESGREVFAYRLLVTTTDRFDRIARRTLDAQEKPVGIIARADLLTAEVPWPASLDELTPSPPPKPAQPRPYQMDAINAVVDGFAGGDRGQLIMACGTGKTLTAQFITAKLGARRTLVLVPSLSLLKQTLRVWEANAAEPFDVLAVCSDATVTTADDAGISRVSELGRPVTTDPEEIARFLRGRAGNRVVFSTYQSSPAVAAAYDLARVPALDLIVADEAHRCAGPVTSDFATVLDGGRIRARRRLFMTATPRYYTGRIIKAAKEADFEVASMDDPATFGQVFHRLGFARAIERKLLTDYQVVIVGVDDAEYQRMATDGALITRDGLEVTDARSLAGQIGLAKAIRKYDLRRLITFHSRVAASRRFAQELPDVISWMPARQRPKGALWASFASGEMTAGQRHILLRQLAELEGYERGLLANARCLAEGVDVPTLDGVAFIDPRRSEVDIIQAVGRAIRNAPDKTIGTIVIPVFIDAATDAEAGLDASEFKPVWDIIKALRAHDDDLAEQIDRMRRELGRRGETPKLPDKIHLDIPVTVDTAFARAFDTHLVEMTSAPWEFWFGLLERYVEEHGTARVPQACRVGEFPLGTWVREQRRKFLEGSLGDESRRRLEELPRWSWNAVEDGWEDDFTALAEYLAEHGTAAIPKEYVVDGRHLGRWVSRQRTWKSKGTLDASRAARLESLPGWTWDRFGDKWEIGFSHLRDYVDAMGTATVPSDYEAGTYRLGAWVGQQRTLFTNGKLPPERQRRLEQLPGWVWETLSGRWEEGYNCLETYAERTGQTRVPQSYATDDGYPLGDWVQVQRSFFAKKKLSEERQRRLEALPGWVWVARDAKWDENYDRLTAYTREHGTSRVPQGHKLDGRGLGAWVADQRTAYAKGKMLPDRKIRLEALPGWAWDRDVAQWDEAFEQVTGYLQENGHIRIPQGYRMAGVDLGIWVNNQRRRARTATGPHAAERVRRLESLPGWDWEPRKQSR